MYDYQSLSTLINFIDASENDNTNVVEDAQKAISEYFYSKAADRNIKKYPEWDVARTDPQTKLLKARRELLQAQDELDAKRTEYNEKRQYMDQQ
ncbi:hypothetical protein PV328_000284 [Microctonus aethiopoides]|uniref:Uncharacterized protein n=1 Tax=Microctonus aethiopoides TaxID=144406 RepID=A0AA39FV52_9HYME|nr:hypothetical protein PV328_000284 [Microctonus aethiopoides]